MNPRFFIDATLWFNSKVGIAFEMWRIPYRRQIVKAKL